MCHQSIYQGLKFLQSSRLVNNRYFKNVKKTNPHTEFWMKRFFQIWYENSNLVCLLPVLFLFLSLEYRRSFCLTIVQTKFVYKKQTNKIFSEELKKKQILQIFVFHKFLLICDIWFLQSFYINVHITAI